MKENPGIKDSPRGNIEAYVNDLTAGASRAPAGSPPHLKVGNLTRRATAGQPLSSKDRMHVAAAGRASEPSVGFGGNLLVPG